MTNVHQNGHGLIKLIILNGHIEWIGFSQINHLDLTLNQINHYELTLNQIDHYDLTFNQMNHIHLMT
jgi:hypothetical protein